MSWTEQAATEIQLSQLRHYGYIPDHPLTLSEASDLLSRYELAEGSGALDKSLHATTREAAYRLHAEVAETLRSGSQQASAAAARRVAFWLDSCREPGLSAMGSPALMDLYMKFGCRFVEPSREHVREVLNALDAVMPEWDRHQPDLFYQTLELNFPELIRHL
jgi:hypothetical protein